uniref:Uncharacterized protein LOC114329571 n=1 Tax=Diabrotica virgifera virgifera TaxID=50390 RepID=A0A6P7FNF7_DIAVI
MGNALLDFAINHKKTITQKYLEVGHTHMECDSVHANIEKKVKNKPIFLPSFYLTATETARSKPMPYLAKWMNYDEFIDYSDSSKYRFKSLRAGTNKVVDLRAIKYTPGGEVLYKTNFDQEWQILPQRMIQVAAPITWNKLNKEPRKISASKFKHLQELKPVIPKDCHAYYDNIPHFT